MSPPDGAQCDIGGTFVVSISFSFSIWPMIEPSCSVKSSVSCDVSSSLPSSAIFSTSVLVIGIQSPIAEGYEPNDYRNGARGDQGHIIFYFPFYIFHFPFFIEGNQPMTNIKSQISNEK